MFTANELASLGLPPLPGGFRFDKVLFVNSTVGGDGNRGDEPGRKALASLFGTSGALAKVANSTSSPNGTLVVCEKGHAENVAAANAGSAIGTNKRVYIVSFGDEVERATLTWTLAASTLLLSNDSLVLDNLNLNLEPGTGNVNVAAPITISGNGCGIRRCKIRGGTDANNKVTVGITVTGDDCFMEDVDYRSADTAEATTHLRLTGADRFRLERVSIDGATSAVGVGSVQFLTTASTFVKFEDFFVANRKAASTAAVSGMAACTGRARRGLLHVLANTAGELTTAWGTKASVQIDGDVYVTNDNGEVGAVLLPRSA